MYAKKPFELSGNSIRLALVLTLALVLLLSLAGCGGSSNNTAADSDPAEPVFDSSLFDENSATVGNEYFPLTPGMSYSYAGIGLEGEEERVELTVSHMTREVDGVNGAIVVAREYEDDELIEETFDWYAEDIAGNVWYLGEDATDYDDEDDEDKAKDGSWESGADIDGIGELAIAGIIMKSNPVAGDSYRQEYYPGIAEDMATIEALGVDITLSDGESYNTLQIREYTPLEPDELEEFKYFSPGIGEVLAENVDGSERVELEEVSDQREPDIGPGDFSNPRVIDNPYFSFTIGEHREYEVYEDGELVETVTIDILSVADAMGDKTVNGVPVVVQLDRVSDEEGLALEDTYDWFAQDDDGNVWYMGESVTNYNYDDDGNFLGTDSGGSFEWGIDGAQPGIQMPAAPRVGDSYRQEYYEDEAEDIAAILAIGVEITVNGVEYETLQTEDWNPLEPEEARERKYYAPGFGVVREEKVDGSEEVVLVSVE